MEILSSIFDLSLINSTIRAATPILYAALAAIITQQADILNIGTEGIMLMGAFVAIAVSFLTGSWVLAVLAAIIGGVLMSLIIGFAHVKFKGDIMVVGIAVNMLSLAVTKFLLRELFGVAGSFYSDKIVQIPKINIGFLKNVPILNDYSLFEILGPIFVLLIWYLLFRTTWGLRTRSVGLNPKAAETAGINIIKTKFQVIIISGVLGGIAGAHLSLGYSSMFVENMTNGRGFMGVAAMYFGGVNPIFAYLGTLIFGFVDSVGARLQSYGFASELILMIPYIATVTILAISMIRKFIVKNKAKSSLIPLK
ncbi:ABC transporter permease [Clostridium algidicarnis]|uniref:ABC transporter permease n=1 Tax=Clostridium algidicarnis TaxID=37659 RepID=UPI003FD7B6B1